MKIQGGSTWVNTIFKLSITLLTSSKLTPGFKIGDGIKIEGKKEEGIEIGLTICLLGCYADVSKNKIILGGIQRTPANITVLKIKRYGTGLTQGYNLYGDSE